MLARRGKLNLGGGLVVDTPLLVPSFSSKGFKDVAKIVSTMSEFITGAVLVSSYDIHYKHIRPRELTFPSFVFLDSGGYEARVEHDLSEAYGHDYRPQPWTQQMHLGVLEHWPNGIGRIVVTYDNPRQSDDLRHQIKRARALQDRFPGTVAEILIKPERRTNAVVPIEALVRKVHELRPFAAVGVTEKEIGDSFLTRLDNVARLRRAMDAADVMVPIHVFGSLDALTTPLYFLAGAEIFDGLTWLRFGYHEGTAMYSENYSIVREVDWLRRRNQDLVSGMWTNNFYYLQSLRDKMATFAESHNFSLFGPIESRLRDAAAALDSPQRRRN